MSSGYTGRDDGRVAAQSRRRDGGVASQTGDCIVGVGANGEASGGGGTISGRNTSVKNRTSSP
ncbi:Uu.00g083590.m01.CDS01 [Anthostomella pinea]|uniref:Uu.00g083590.m01.CDS01 n=1 Tax=Anthostomella pinea TaxID=933095 RepID=A0AAI8YJR6_9PEZI|nr:Uu.00g083590.m01.CDS01 [Anthostomella pinea]